MDQRVVEKVVAYIVVDGRVAVFRHRDFPAVGIQVPAGTVRPDEPAADAVLREAAEETGLDGLAIVEHLGSAWFDMSAFGKQERHHREFFWLSCRQRPLPDTWVGAELHDGLQPPTWFDFWWMPLAEAADCLVADQGVRLAAVRLDP